MFRMQTGLMALIGFVAFAFQPASDAEALTLIAGQSYQFEIHSGEDHSNETLDGIDLSFGSFANTSLKNSSLTAGIFVQTDFSDTDFKNADLQNADLTDAIFNAGSNLKNADLSNAVLIGIDLTGVDVQNTTFTGATYDLTSTLPFDPVAEGMILAPELSPSTLIMLGLLVIAALKHGERRGAAFVSSAV